MLRFLQFVTLLFLTTVKLANADKPPPIIVSGMCSSASVYDGFYQAMYETATGRWYYKNNNEMYFYFDPSCNGSGASFGQNRWIANNVEPSTTAVNDLDGELRINVAHLYLFIFVVLPSLSICRRRHMQLPRLYHLHLHDSSYRNKYVEDLL